MKLVRAFDGMFFVLNTIILVVIILSFMEKEPEYQEPVCRIDTISGGRICL